MPVEPQVPGPVVGTSRPGSAQPLPGSCCRTETKNTQQPPAAAWVAATADVGQQTRASLGGDPPGPGFPNATGRASLRDTQTISLRSPPCSISSHNRAWVNSAHLAKTPGSLALKPLQRNRLSTQDRNTGMTAMPKQSQSSGQQFSAAALQNHLGHWATRLPTCGNPGANTLDIPSQTPVQHC